MDMDLLGFLMWYKNRSAANIMISDKGYHLSDREAKAYARWGIENGYKSLKDLPEFEEVRDKLKL